ncbi:hypothetical protein CY658_05100 [Variovorax sp. RO1]|uniref:hypothetical protein n=1 Tax=Variovorax sp. RO1 TaxID=2066034 RepID=UPI000C71652E|nr:hypothetical protein [Variovorax sp. RO1]PLC06412.1 hypothetical protein CY658_05100 [Variovorax sp. RO1]
MANSTSPVPQVVEGTGAVASINELFDAGSQALIGGRWAAGITGPLKFAVVGGRANGVDGANTEVTLTASSTNYVVRKKSDGVVSSSTSNTNWNDAATYYRLYTVVTGASSVTSYTDERLSSTGIFGSAGVGSGDVVGPAGVTADRLAVFDGITGKVIKDGGFTVAGLRAPAIQAVTSAATVTPTFADDIVKVTAQAAALALANPTGTAIDALGIVIRIKDNGTARAITYGTQYRAIGVTLPTTTVVSKTLYLAMIYNTEDTKWDVVAVGQEA